MGGSKRKKGRKDIKSKWNHTITSSLFQHLPTSTELLSQRPLIGGPRRSLRWSHARLLPLLLIPEQDPQLQLEPRCGPHHAPVVCGDLEKNLPRQQQDQECWRHHGPFAHNLRQHILQTHNPREGPLLFRSSSAHGS